MRKLLALIYFSFSVCAVLRAQDKNIVFILVDDQGWNGTSVQMDPSESGSKSDYYQTPNLESLAAGGMTFSQAYAPAAKCSPSRNSILTGQTTAASFFTNTTSQVVAGKKLLDPSSSTNIDSDLTTFPEVIKAYDSNYMTGHFGKWHLGSNGPESHGFDRSDGDTGNLASQGTVEQTDPKLIYAITDSAISFMEDAIQATRPFYVQLSHYAVHTPVEATASSIATYANPALRPVGTVHTDGDYGAMTEDLDASLSAILDSLVSWGIEDDTYVVYMSDNGAQKNVSRNTPLQSGKKFLWEGGLRVPLIIKGPSIPTNSRSAVPVVGYDLYPTFIEWITGSTSAVPSNVDGGSFASVALSGTGTVSRANNLVFHSPHFNASSAIKKPRSAIVQDNMKMIVNYMTGSFELYNLSSDIEETTDVAASNPTILEDLKLELRDYLRSVSAQMPILNPAHNSNPGSSPDSDQDGLEDAWEVVQMLTTDFVDTDDPDGDGFDNAAEFLAGMDPYIWSAQWEGTTSSSWNVGSNWSGGLVPISTYDVVIPSAPSNQPHVTLTPTSPAACNTLTVNSGATLTINAGKALTVNGNTENEGTILIKSNASAIGSFIDNGTIGGAGTFSMEQYLSGSGGSTPDGLFYYVSSPTAAATSNVYDAAGTDKLWSASETTQSYSEITSNSTPLNVTEGYVARMGAAGSNSFTGGAFNTGKINASNLTRTGVSASNRGYNLVGNPYPSTVSWDDLDKTNLETTMWYRTHNGSDMLMDTYNSNGGVGTNNNGGGQVTGVIPPTQAFWVRVDADGNTGSINFDNADRSHGTLAGIYRMEAEEGNVRIALSDGVVSDEQIILFNSDASDGFDDYDSHKFWSSNVPQLYTNIYEDTLTINGMNSPSTNPTVPLGMKVPSQGDYTLTASSITLAGTPVYLEDTELNVTQNLNIIPSYSFHSDAGNIGNRFILHFTQVTGVDELGSYLNIYGADNVIHIIRSESNAAEVTVLDLSGRAIHKETIHSKQATIELNTATGVYLIKVDTDGKTVTRKAIIQ